ncbi:MAG TPA: MMPL family transporter [Candidatus Paceibacterota bacterium]|nr:MMPL family transporter [Verrucomicrobiota bacterium]HSA10873.1 MMPL family transporter [Candidatus Paceibacterota bacterium]
MQIKPLSTNSLMARSLAWLAGMVIRHRRLFSYPPVALFVVSILITVKYPGIEFSTSRNDLVGANKKYHQNFLRLKKEFPTQDDLVVLVESEDTEKNRQFVERLGAKLEAETNLFHDVFYKGDLKMLGAKALLFVPDSDLAELSRTLKDFRPFIARFTTTTNLDSLFKLICTQFRTAKQEANAANESLINALPALERIITQATASLRRPGIPPSPGVTALFDPGEEAQQQMYITFAQGRIYLVTAQAPVEELNGAAVMRLRELVAETKLEVPGLNVGLTGEPVLEMDEMAQSQKDTMAASIVSLVLCALIFIYGYQETGRPVKATFCLVIGLGYTLAFATLVIGHLNILTITFLPILIGLAIDYGVHLISRYEEELRHGHSEEVALTKAMAFTGQGILTGGLTTAGGFLAMGLTNFKGIQEMGIICGGGLIICLVPMMTLLPVLLLRGRQNMVDHELGDAADKRARIENLWLQRPALTAGITLALCAAAATQIFKVHFDYNLLHMQSKGLAAVEYEKALINATPKSVLFGAVIATNLQQASAFEQQLTNLPAVASVDSITGFLREDQTRKLAIVGEIKRELASLRFAEPDPQPVDLQELSATLYSLGGYLGAALDEVQKEAPELVPQFQSLRAAIEQARKEMLRGDTNQLEASSLKLAAFQRSLFNDIRDTFQALRTQDDRAPLSVGDLPQALRNRFIGVTGKYLLMVYPRGDIWNRQVQKVFIEQVGKVDPNVTGTPVQLFHYTALLKDSYQQAAWYSLAAITVLVFIHFRNLPCVGLALVPVAIGALWLGGLMGWLGVPLNPANIMTLPLVIGIGVTNGIHILNRFAEEQTPSILARSTGKAVLVSGLTSMAGFGSLMLARHQGIYSLGCVMTTGLATCMIAGLTFLPALLNLLRRLRLLTEQPSADNARSTLGREEPR